jgi:chemotaxis response regulator CheB
LLADDQPMLRLGFRAVLDAQPDMHVVAEAGDGATAVSMTAATKPDVVLMDVRMPGTDGIQATRQIVTAGGMTRVLILTTFDVDEYAYAGLRAGASGSRKERGRAGPHSSPASLTRTARVQSRSKPRRCAFCRDTEPGWVQVPAALRPPRDERCVPDEDG